MEYVNLKTCPICGAYPEKEISDMGRPGGHGYPGHYSYQYYCNLCGLLKGESYDDVYCSLEGAVDKAKQSWNDECDRVITFIKNKNK